MGGFQLRTELAQEGLLGECLPQTILLMAKYPVEILTDLMKNTFGPCANRCRDDLELLASKGEIFLSN